MVKFGEYIECCIIEKYREKYIPYEELKGCMSITESGKLKGHQEFYQLLDRSYFTCKNFAEEWLSILEKHREFRPDIFSEALSLHQFVAVNQEALRKIIKKHDKNIPSKKLFPTWRWKSDFGLTQRTIDVLFKAVKSKPAESSKGMKVPLHPVDEEAGWGESDNDGEDGENHDDPTASLSKQSDSFVRQSTKYWVHSCDLPALCTALAENLNVYVFGDGGSPWTHISSVYLDSAARSCYSDRIVKEAGARILRLRTYNDDVRQVFVERKVHWEKWTGEQSSKDRFPIHEDQVLQLLRGNAVEVPPKSEALRDEFQAMIRDKKLYPVVRVDYDRVAFQPATHDHVRVSIDLNMRFLQERATHMEWRTPEERFLVEDEILFPYSIVEVKLREPYISSPPQWLEQIQQSSLMHKENNFSKYIHAAFAFSHMDGNALNLRQPCWWENMTFVSPQMAVETTALTPSKSKSKGASGKDYLKINSSDQSGYGKLEDEPTAEKAKSSFFSGLYLQLFQPELAISSSGEKPLKVEPKTLFAAERTFLSWFNSSLFVCSFGVAIAAGGNFASGCLMVGVGVVLIAYALVTYMRRTRALLLRQGTGYFDQYGPILLSGIAIGVFLTALCLGKSTVSTSSPTFAPTHAPI